MFLSPHPFLQKIYLNYDFFILDLFFLLQLIILIFFILLFFIKKDFNIGLKNGRDVDFKI
jgi:hypothetical protein